MKVVDWEVQIWLETGKTGEMWCAPKCRTLYISHHEWKCTHTHRIMKQISWVILYTQGHTIFVAQLGREVLSRLSMTFRFHHILYSERLVRQAKHLSFSTKNIYLCVCVHVTSVVNNLILCCVFEIFITRPSIFASNNTSYPILNIHSTTSSPGHWQGFSLHLQLPL